MKLLGAKEFLKTVKPGTLCVEFWRTEKDCLNIIEDFKKGIDICKKYDGEFYIFGDNSGSLSFLESDEPDVVKINDKPYSCLFYYDKNIVGDASPSETVQLVFESEEEYPEEISIRNSEEKLSKSEIISIQKWFVENEHLSENPPKWVLEYLDNNYKDNEIVNCAERRNKNGN